MAKYRLPEDIPDAGVYISMSEEHNFQLSIDVETTYIDEQSDPENDRFVFAYTIIIRNTGTVAAKLISRHWIITDGDGHVQEVKTILYDCDKDTILIRVEQKGPGACHTGHRSCFFTDIQGHTISDEVFSAEDVYGKPDDS